MSNEHVDVDDPGRFRPNAKPFLWAVLANVLFGAVLLGLPYLRGRARAEEAVGAFERFAACLLDAEVAPPPAGLSLPRGDRARFATVFVERGAEWNTHCADALDAIAPEPVTFIFPSVKTAETQVLAERDRVSRAMAAAAHDRERAPAAVLDALSRLQAALVEQVRAAGIEVDPMREAIRLGAREDLPTPSIVPMQVASGGPWSIALEDGVLLATAADARALAHVRVSRGSVDLRLARRPSLASAVLGAREPPWIVFSTSPSQCADAPAGCAQRATGLAALTEDRQHLAPFAWLGAHPLGAPEDAVLLDRDAVWIAALGEGGRLDVRRFPIPERGEGEPAQVASTLSRETELAGVERVAWMTGEPPALVWAGADGAGVVREGTADEALESPGGHVEIATCGTAGEGWIVLASERGVRVRHGASVLRLDAGPTPPDRGALDVACDAEALDVVLRRERALLHSRCDAQACTEPETLTSDMDAFDVARFEGALYVAHAREHGPVHVVRVRGAETDTALPAACWDSEDGLCGEPRLATDGSQLALVTRHGADLRVLLSDDGARWRSLAGLGQP